MGDVCPGISGSYRGRRAVAIDRRRGGVDAFDDRAKHIARHHIVVGSVVARGILHYYIARILKIEAALILDDVVGFDPIARGDGINTGEVLRRGIVADQAGAAGEANSLSAIV